MLPTFSLFKNLSTSEIEAIRKVSQNKIISATTVFIKQEDNSDTVYFIVEGTVKVYRINEEGEEISICVLGQNDMVGEMSLVDHLPHSAYVKALTDTTVIALSHNDFKSIISTYPNIAIGLLASFSSRLRNSNEHLEEMLTESLLTRTWNTLQILKNYSTDSEIHLSHDELASVVGATRARVTEVLNLLQKEGKIQLAHRKIIIK